MLIQINQPSASDGEKIRAIPWILAAGFLNIMFALWTFGGSVFLFFLNELGLPKGQIGAILALFPFCGLLALGFAPLAMRWGWKRVFLICYGSRKFVMALLLFLPWVLTQAGHMAGMLLLFSVIIAFALLRALAETAYCPWSQDFTPNYIRGKFAGISTVVVTIGSGVALLIAGQVIGQGAGLSRYLSLLAAGCVLGLLGVIMMVKVPGGAPRHAAEAPGAHRAQMAAALRDHNFIAYLGGIGGVTLGAMLLVSFLPLYMKDQIGVAPGTVVLLDSAAMGGGALASLLLGWVADRVGSRPVLLPSVAISLLVPLGWLLLPRQLPHATAWCAALYFMYGVAANGTAIAAGRLLFNGVIPPERSTAYTAIYYAWIGATGGMASLLAGGILSASAGWRTRIGPIPVDGNSLLFILALAFLAAGWWLFCLVRPDDRHTTRTVLKYLLEAALWRGLFQNWR